MYTYISMYLYFFFFFLPQQYACGFFTPLQLRVDCDNFWFKIRCRSGSLLGASVILSDGLAARPRVRVRVWVAAERELFKEV